MQLMRLGAVGSERPVVRVDDRFYVDVSDVVGDFDGEFFEGGLTALEEEFLRRRDAGEVHPFAAERVGAPLARPHQILCIGLNFSDHAAESGMPIPAEPILFTKSPNTLVGPDDDVRLPPGSTKTDWEVELGIVIGKRASYLKNVSEAREAVAGFVLCNDISERSYQLERGGQWTKGKSSATFNPCGPWIATRDEFDDEVPLAMWLDVNGERRQTGSTETMIFDPWYIVGYLSQFMVLEPGDLINTGTPPGVGLGMNPPVYLEEGDVMTLGIDRLGAQRQRVVATPNEGAEWVQ